MSKPRSVGRPSLGKRGLSVVLSIKISAQLRAEWERAAKRKNMTLPEFIRAAVGRAVERGLG